MNSLDKPTLQDFHIEGVKHITPENAYNEISKNRAVLIDVREIHEVKIETIPLDNVLYHPMSLIMERLPFIAKDQQIILGCTKGVRSSKVANLMNLQGYPNVANLDGGFQTWKARGMPYETHLSFAPAGGCGCGCNSASSGKTNGSCC